MGADPKKVTLDESSPSVQTHLGIIQNVIQRMATNSTSCKAWCITLVSAILVIIADKGKPKYAWITLVPTILFFALDAYYLALEKGFRQSYNVFITKLHAGKVQPEDLYSISPSGDMTKHQLQSIASFSIWGFYGCLTLLVYVAWSVVLKP